MALRSRANPFEADIVSDPWAIERPVVGLNDDAFNQLVEKSQALSMGPPPRMRKASHAYLVVSPRPGCGKTHLIGRLFRALRGHAILVHIPPFEDNTACWRTILHYTLQNFLQPEPASSEKSTPTQLALFGHHLVLFILKSLIPESQSDSRRHHAFLEKVDRVPHARFIENDVNREWIFGRAQELIRKFQALLDHERVQLHASPGSWINAILQATYAIPNGNLQEASHEWLQGQQIHDEDARGIAIRPKDRVRRHAGIGELDEICKHRILDFCHIAGFVRPFVFCFDQTDNYAGDKYLSRALGAVIQVLVDNAPNQMTLVAANQNTWVRHVEPYLAQSHVDRLSEPIELQGLNRQQGWALIRQRMDTVEDEGSLSTLADVESWLGELFAAGGQLGARDFLRQCWRRWNLEAGQGSLPKREVDAHFENAVDEVRNNPRRLRYDPNPFFWLIHKAAQKHTDLDIQVQRSRVGYFSVSWIHKNRVMMFGFESGADPQRWQAIIDAGNAFFRQNPQLKVIYFRTPELAPLAGSDWGDIRDAFQRARHAFLDIIEITQPEMIDLYALHDLYVAAMEGDIPYDIKDILAYSRQRLKPFFRRMVRPVETITEDFISSLPMDGLPDEGRDPTAVADMTVEAQIRQITERERIVTLEDLNAKLSETIEIEDLAHRVDEMQNLKQYPHADLRQTVIIWQSRP